MTTTFPASPSPFRPGAALQLAETAGWNPAEMPRYGKQEQAALLQLVPGEVALAVTSPSTPVTVAGVRAGYSAALLAMLGATWSRTIASVFPSSSPSETYPWLRSAPNPRKWEGERTFQELRGDVVTIVNDDYESTIEFKVPDFRRDKTQQIAQRAQDLATRVAFFPESLLTALLVANGNAYDGKAFFAVDHVVGQSGAINNALVAADGLAGGANPTTDQMSANISRALSAMLGFRDDQGQPLHASARQFAVMVPAPMYAATVAAINSAFTSAAASNPLPELSAVGYSFVPILNPRLTATNQFYLFRVDGGIRSLLLQEEGVNPVELGPESEHAKKTNRVLFGHGWAGGVGYGRFEFAMRGTTS
ncbi:MAG: Mu-like prophage major head subunit gpT family protein [Pseudomonadota bacterium]|jgi:phage major head subunit gpT-like protein